MAENLPRRKSPRLPGWDYSAPGAYFVTVCTREKEKLLGKVVGGGIYDAPQMRLSQYGTAVEEGLREMGDCAGVTVEKTVIMPNHIHLLLLVRKLPGGSSQAPNPTNATIPKFISLFKRRCNRLCGENVLQRSYHDHVIRDEADYRRIWTYIDENPAKWREDCFYCE